MMKQNKMNLTKKKYFSIAIISAIILMIFIKNLFLEQEKEAESFLMDISLSSYMKRY